MIVRINKFESARYDADFLTPVKEWSIDEENDEPDKYLKCLLFIENDIDAFINKIQTLFEGFFIDWKQYPKVEIDLIRDSVAQAVVAFISTDGCKLVVPNIWLGDKGELLQYGSNYSGLSL